MGETDVSPMNPSRRGLGRLSRPPFMRGIPGFVIRRVVLGLLTLWLVSVVVFAATQALPGDPARAFLGRNATPESVKELRKQLNLNRPALDQYGSWLKGLVTGDLGHSLTGTREPVTKVLGTPLRNSAFLVLIAAVISVPLSILLGAISARKRDKPFDHVASVSLLSLAALPEFVVAIALVVLFGTTVWTVLPAVSLIPPGEGPWNHANELILPVLTLVIAVT